MKLGFISAAAMLTLLPGAALADSATYTAVYSPVLDATTRSCEITSPGVRGGIGLTSASVGGIGTVGDNTAVMRTIGKDAGSAESTAGIQFDMVGANIVAITGATMTADRGTVNTNGTIKVNLPNARVDVRNSVSDTLGFTPTAKAGNTVAEVSFQNGAITGKGQNQNVGSVVVGQRRGGNRLSNNPSYDALANDRSSGRRTGTVNFTLTGIDRDTPTTVMQATISCEPVPVVRNEIRDKNNSVSPMSGRITAVRQK